MTTRATPIRTIVLECPRCGQFHDVVAGLVSAGCSYWCQHGSGPHDDPDIRFTLPSLCGCGESLDTPENTRDVEDSAALMFLVEGYL